MKLNAVFAATAALIVGSGVAMSQTTTTTTTRTTFAERFSYDADSEDRYRANEFSVDAYGTYQRPFDEANDFFDEPEGGDWGAGLGVNYFFTRNFGVGADATWFDNRGAFVDHANLSAIGRFPLGDSGVAPYIFGGGGRLFEDEAWTFHGGLGFEFRINQHTGIFIDGRLAWGEQGNDYSLIRSGLRFAF